MENTKNIFEREKPTLVDVNAREEDTRIYNFPEVKVKMENGTVRDDKEIENLLRNDKFQEMIRKGIIKIERHSMLPNSEKPLNEVLIDSRYLMDFDELLGNVKEKERSDPKYKEIETRKAPSIEEQLENNGKIIEPLYWFDDLRRSKSFLIKGWVHNGLIRLGNRYGEENLHDPDQDLYEIVIDKAIRNDFLKELDKIYYGKE